MEKEDFINSILNSTGGMQPAQPSADLFFRIRQKIKYSNKVKPAAIWWVAASAAVLVMANIGVLSHENNSAENNPVSAVATALTNNNQLY